MELYTGCFEINNGRINGTNKKKKDKIQTIGICIE